MIRTIQCGFKLLVPNCQRLVSVGKGSYTTYPRMMFSTVEAVSSESQTPEVDPALVEKVEAALRKEEKNILIDHLGRTYGTGRRKTSVARVWLKPGTGQCTVNGQSFVDYFQTNQRMFALEPFNATATSCVYDVLCTVKGGGISGQAGAVRLGISRALEKFQSELRPPLRKGGYLTRDPRMVERKKPGQKKARKQYQWVKR